MKITSCSLSLALRVATFGMILSTGALLNIARAASESAPPTALRLADFLWRDVQNQQGEPLGATSDVLVEMPSGRIVFVLIKPRQIYAEPRAVPPGSLSAPTSDDSALKLDISLDEWINAPRIDWDPKVIAKYTEKGAEIYGFYNQNWLQTAPGAEAPGVNVVAGKKDDKQPVRFVSLNNLVMHRVASPAWETAGFVRGFLLDWNSHRATHALVSRVFDPLPVPNDSWFAIPVSLLNPPVEQDALTIDTNEQAFANARTVSAESDLPISNTTDIFQFPPSTQSASAQTKSAPKSASE